MQQLEKLEQMDQSTGDYGLMSQLLVEIEAKLPGPLPATCGGTCHEPDVPRREVEGIAVDDLRGGPGQGLSPTTGRDYDDGRRATIHQGPEELVATKSLTQLKIVAKFMTIYQPDGFQEKTVALRQLKDPREIPSNARAVGELRRWLRWLRTAQDVGPGEGLARLMRKVLTRNTELGFRASLVENTVQLDTIPSHETAQTYAEHLLVEMEQLHLEKQTKQAHPRFRSYRLRPWRS